MASIANAPCHALGVCQCRTPACPDCTPRAVTMYGPCSHDCNQSDDCTCAWQVPTELAQAARDAGCFVPLGNLLDAPCRPTRRVGRALYWAAVYTSAATVVVLALIGAGAVYAHFAH